MTSYWVSPSSLLRRSGSTCILSRRSNSSLQPDNAQALTTTRLASHESSRGLHLVLPAAENSLHVAGNALEDDGRDGNEWPVLQRGRQDAVFLGK